MDREKVIKGLECCLPAHDPDCDLCPYDSIDLRCRAKLRDDILALLKAQEPVVMAGAELTDAELIEEIRKAPLVLKQNVDAVPVVRCRDCKHWCRCDDGISGTCGALGGLWDENEFCSDGERRDDE